MRKFVLAGLVWLVAGCEGPDPAADVLPAGREAIAVPGAKDGDKYRGRVVVDTEKSRMEMIAGGTKVRVVADEPDDERKGYRKVRVLILEGEHAGESATIARLNLRPLE